MLRSRSILVGILVGFLALTLSASLVLGQTEEVRINNTKQMQPTPQTETVAPTTDPILMAEFDVRIQQIRDDATREIAELETAMQSRTGADQETYLRQIEDVKKNAQISILEVRGEQELARGNTELAVKFQQAAEMLRNPAPRQAPNPQADQRRFEETPRTSEPSTR